MESKPIDSNVSEAVVGEQLAHLMLRASEAPEAWTGEVTLCSRGIIWKPLGTLPSGTTCDKM